MKQSITPALWIAAILATGAVRPLLAQTAPAETSPRVFVEVKDSDLTDAQWASIAEAIAAEVPFANWKKVGVRQNEGLGNVVDRYYDIYTGTTKKVAYSRPLPTTSKMLVDLIEDANDVKTTALTVGQEVSVPPVPVRASAASADSSVVRIFDPQTEHYAVFDTSYHGTPVAGLYANRDAYRPAATLAPLREAGRTIFALSPQRAATLGFGRVVSNYVSVRLLQAKPCVAPDPVIKTSPYLQFAHTQLAGKLDELKKKSANRRLVLIDFDFEKGHGSQVRSAARWVLNHLSVASLADEMREVELNPSGYSTDVPVDLIKLGQRYVEWGAKFGVTSSDAYALSGWLMYEKPGVGKAEYTVPPILLQAAVWDHLDRGNWLNLSWMVSASSGALPVELDPLLKKSGSFVAVAAGNDAEEVRADRTPQSAASIVPQFANVTFGAPDGTIYGTWTGSAGGRVDVLAPGCGITYGTLTPDLRGSSYASPIVAAAAWLKHLLDGTTATDMRRLLIRASSLVPPRTEKVASGGAFDPARLLANVGAHYVDPPRRTITTIKDVDIRTNGASCPSLKPNAARPASQDVIVYNSGGKYFLLHRSEFDAYPNVGIAAPCEITQLTMTGVTPAGAVTIGSPADFVARIGQLTF